MISEIQIMILTFTVSPVQLQSFSLVDTLEELPLLSKLWLRLKLDSFLILPSNVFEPMTLYSSLVSCFAL